MYLKSEEDNHKRKRNCRDRKQNVRRFQKRKKKFESDGDKKNQMYTLFKWRHNSSITGGSLNGTLKFCTIMQPHSFTYRVSYTYVLHE